MTREQFYSEVRELLFLIREAGGQLYEQKGGDFNSVNLTKYFSCTNAAFKVAQEKVLKLMVQLTKEKVDNNSEIKNARKAKDKEKENQLGLENKYLNHWLKVLRHVIDAIAYQIYGGKVEVIRRFYISSTGEKELSGKGFDAMIAKAKLINSDPLKFALITDLSSNLEVGDLHIWTFEGIGLEEVKSGKVNKQILDLLDMYKSIGADPEVRVEKMENGHFKKQFERVLRQKERMKDSYDFLASGEFDKGIGIKQHLIDPKYHLESYQNIIPAMIKKSYEKGYDYQSIDGIIHIGVYRLDWRKHKGPDALKETVDGFDTYDLLGCLQNPIVEPLFNKLWSIDDIMQVLTGEVRVLLGIDWEYFMEVANRYGGDFRWATRKETNEAKSIPEYGKEVFIFNNKAMILNRIGDEEGRNGFLAYGLIWQMVFNHIKPEGIIKNLLSDEDVK